jgi:hypothetical protein
MPDPLDDVDLLFERAGQIDPPDDFLARVLVSAQANPTPVAAVRPKQQPAAVAGLFLLALMALSLLAYQLGAAVAHNGVNVLLETLIRNGELLSDAPAAYAGALLASVPWLNLLAVVFDLAILVLAGRLLTADVRSPGQAEG